MSNLCSYDLWNYMLAEQCLLTDAYEGTVLLTVTPRVLAAAVYEAGEGLCSSEEAEKYFVAAVADVYKSRVVRSREGLSALKSSDKNEVPLCVGFLALSVLAAFHMRTDDERTGRAYYPRLAAMLACELIGNYPAGFDGNAFVQLWEELAQWLKVQYGRRLALPNAGGVRKYIAYPLSHVPLREVDIERLPQFFDSYGYEPGARAPLDRLEYDLYQGSGPWRYLTEAGQEALKDPVRRPFVISQVAHELERWDGCRTESSGVRIATIELWMDIRRRQAQLFLVARRPEGFPELIDNGELMFESSQEGWYAPVPLGPEDGTRIGNGIRVAAHSSGSRYVLQLRPADAIPLTPSDEYAGFVSDRVLRMTTRCAVLCRESIAEKVVEFLGSVTQGPVYPRRNGNLPADWCLFPDVYPTAIVEPPSGLERLRVESSLALVLKGGLRLGRRWTWLENAPADVSVIGERQGLVVRIDGQEVVPESDGRLPSALLHSEGLHVVEIGDRLRQRITVLPGAIHPECRSWGCTEAALSQIPISIPEGEWVIVGASPGERENMVAGPDGALIRPEFCAQWALKVGGGPGAVALHLHDLGASFTGKLSRDNTASNLFPSRQRVWALAWAEAIYQTGVRRPVLACNSNCQPQNLATEWRRLKEKAHSIKRRMRKR